MPTDVRRQPLPPGLRTWTFSGLGAWAARALGAVAIALCVYLGSEEVGRRAATALPGQAFEVALPVVIIATLIVLFALPIFGRRGGNFRELSAMTAMALLAVGILGVSGLFNLDSRTLSMHVPAAGIASTVSR